MLYLIPSKSLITKYLFSGQLQEVEDIKTLTKAFHPTIFFRPLYNSDFLINYSKFKELEDRYNPYIKTKLSVEEVIKARLEMIGKFKKNNFDVFIKVSKNNFEKTCEYLSAIAKSVGVKIDYTTLSKENLTNLTDNFEEYYEEQINQDFLTGISSNLTKTFFEIKNKYNTHKIANMNRLTTNGLSNYYDWFKNGYVSYKHILSFSQNDLKLSARNADKKTLFTLFGYLPSNSDSFPDSAFKYIKKLIKKSHYSAHKIAMMIEYYKGKAILDNDFDYKPPYEYFFMGTKRKIDRQFLVYFSLALGLSLEEIKTLFQKSNCVLTDFLKEDLLLCYFAKNNYFIDVKQRGALFRFILGIKNPT